MVIPMIKNPTQQRLKELFYYNPETGGFTRLISVKGVKCKEGDTTSQKVNSSGYLRIMVDGVRYQAHRLAWIYVHGDIPNQMHIDHINRDRADNRICNLRLATNQQNRQNSKANLNNTSGKKGVYWHKRDACWYVAIGVAGKLKHLGYFKDRETADLARDRAEKIYFKYIHE